MSIPGTNLRRREVDKYNLMDTTEKSSKKAVSEKLVKPEKQSISFMKFREHLQKIENAYSQHKASHSGGNKSFEMMLKDDVIPLLQKEGLIVEKFYAEEVDEKVRQWELDRNTKNISWGQRWEKIRQAYAVMGIEVKKPDEA